MPDRKPQELFAISCKANIMGRMELVCFGMYRYEKKRKIHAQKISCCNLGAIAHSYPSFVIDD